MSHRALCVGLCAESPTQRNGEGILEFRMPTQEKWTPLRVVCSTAGSASHCSEGKTKAG